MIPPDLEALVLADSVGALDLEEQVELHARLASSTAEQRSEVANLYNAAATVALTAPEMAPPADVRARVLAAAREPLRYTVWADESAWIDTGMPGIRSRILAVDLARSLVTLLIRAEPGAVYPSHKHHGPEDCYVISGSVLLDGRVLRAGDFHHADASSEHGEIATADGAEVLIVGSVHDYLPPALRPRSGAGR